MPLGPLGRISRNLLSDTPPLDRHISHNLAHLAHTSRNLLQEMRTEFAAKLGLKKPPPPVWMPLRWLCCCCVSVSATARGARGSSRFVRPLDASSDGSECSMGLPRRPGRSAMARKAPLGTAEILDAADEASRLASIAVLASSSWPNNPSSPSERPPASNLAYISPASVGRVQGKQLRRHTAAASSCMAPCESAAPPSSPLMGGRVLPTMHGCARVVPARLSMPEARPHAEKIDRADGRTDRADGRTNRVDGRTDRVDGWTDRVDGRTDRADARVGALPSGGGRHVDAPFAPVSPAGGGGGDCGWPCGYDTMGDTLSGGDEAMGSTLEWTECNSDCGERRTETEEHDNELQEELSYGGSAAGRSASSSAFTGTTAISCRAALWELQNLADAMAAAADMSKVGLTMGSGRSAVSNGALSGSGTLSSAAAATVAATAAAAAAAYHAAATVRVESSRTATADARAAAAEYGDAPRHGVSELSARRSAATSPRSSRPSRHRARTPTAQLLLGANSTPSPLSPSHTALSATAPSATALSATLRSLSPTNDDGCAVSVEPSLRVAPLPPVPDGMPPLSLGRTQPA